MLTSEVIRNLLYVFGISMVPIIELRGSIPVGLGLGLPWWLCLPVAIIGNMIPVPLILFLLIKILEFMKKHLKFLNKFVIWLEKRTEKKSGIVEKYSMWGLLIFAALPLPGTGAITSSTIAALLKIRFRDAFLYIFAGIVCSGIIVTLISMAAITAFSPS